MAYEELVKPNDADKYPVKIGKRVANTLAGFIAGFLTAAISAAVAYYTYINYWCK